MCHRLSTILMKGSSVVMTHLLNVTLVTHVNSCLSWVWYDLWPSYGNDMAWQLLRETGWLQQLRLYLAQSKKFFVLVFWFWKNFSNNTFNVLMLIGAKIDDKMISVATLNKVMCNVLSGTVLSSMIKGPLQRKNHSFLTAHFKNICPILFPFKQN